MDWDDHLTEQLTRERQSLQEALGRLESGKVIPGGLSESGQWVETTARDIERTRRQIAELDASLRRLERK